MMSECHAYQMYLLTYLLTYLLPNLGVLPKLTYVLRWGPGAGPCTGSDPVVKWNCCPYKCGGCAAYNKTSCGGREKMCQTACAAALDTPFRMGGIHPRSKTQVGDRLATAYYNTLGGGKGAWVGPTLSGCTVDADSLHIMFNTTLLMGDTLKINKWGEPYLPPVRHASPYGGSYLYVQTNASQFCMEKTNVVNASGGVVPGMEGKYLRTLTGPGRYLLLRTLLTLLAYC